MQSKIGLSIVESGGVQVDFILNFELLAKEFGRCEKQFWSLSFLPKSLTDCRIGSSFISGVGTNVKPRFRTLISMSESDNLERLTTLSVVVVLELTELSELLSLNERAKISTFHWLFVQSNGCYLVQYKILLDPVVQLL